jgi:teichuronic acid biosynthesis glycosyltransferase TuaH
VSRPVAAPGRWRDLIVLCATTSFDGMPMGDWHLARALSRLAPVLFVDRPTSPLTPLRRPATFGRMTKPGLSVLGPRMARLVPIVAPGLSRPGSVDLATVLLRGYLRRAVAALGGSVAAVISGWPLYPIKGACDERVSVYWAKDDFVGGAALLGVNEALLDRQERRVATVADLIVAANPLVAQTWRLRGLDPVLIPFGTDTGAYLDVDSAPRPADACLPPPVAGFVGRLNARTDLDLLEGVADRGLSLLLVGPADPGFESARFAALLARPGVRWVGPKPFAALPGYLRVIDVGLVPYRDSAFNRGSFPLKTLEYLAAGRAVVGTDLPATRWLDTDLVCIAAGPADFAAAAERLARGPRTPDIVARRREFAARHSWACRAQEMHDRVVSMGRA